MSGDEYVPASAFAPERGVVRLERLLPGPIELVWAYLTEPEKRATWLAHGALEPRPGGIVELRFHNEELSPEPTPERFRNENCDFTGRVLRCEPPRVLVHTWDEPDLRHTEVSFELTAQPDGRVLLVLTHRQLPDRPTLIGVAGGWDTHTGILADRLAGRAPRLFWSTFLEREAEYGRTLPEL